MMDKKLLKLLWVNNTNFMKKHLKSIKDKVSMLKLLKFYLTILKTSKEHKIMLKKLIFLRSGLD